MAQVVPMEKAVRFVTDLIKPVMHLKRAKSIAGAVFGAMHADRLSSSKIGTALAIESGKAPKHGIKQVDRLLGNKKFDVRPVFEAIVPWIIGLRRQEIVVSLDWTEYAENGQSRIALNLVTKHGRATPLIWMTVETSRLAGQRNAFEDEILILLSKLVPVGTKVIVVADRGFGDQKLYRLLQQLGMDFIIRFRGVVTISCAPGVPGTPAEEWVPSNGRIREIPDALVTQEETWVGAVVLVKERGMKEPWILATSLQGQRNRVVRLYGRRFTCEENFRDEKNERFGLASKQTRVSTCERRDRLQVIFTLATVLLTLLGAAGETLGLDRLLKSCTTTRRTHSLFWQGRCYLQGAVGRFRRILQKTLWVLVNGVSDTTEVFAWI